MNLHVLASQIARAETFLKVLANRHRLMILCEILNGERTVTALQARIGLSQSALSQHLARLRADDIVTTRRAAQAIYYSLQRDDVARIIALLHELFCQSGCPIAATARKSRRTAR